MKDPPSLTQYRRNVLAVTVRWRLDQLFIAAQCPSILSKNINERQKEEKTMGEVKMLCWKKYGLGPNSLCEKDIKSFTPEELVDILISTEKMLTRIHLGNDERYSLEQLETGAQALRDEAVKRMGKRTRKK